MHATGRGGDTVQRAPAAGSRVLPSPGVFGARGWTGHPESGPSQPGGCRIEAPRAEEVVWSRLPKLKYLSVMFPWDECIASPPGLHSPASLREARLASPFCTALAGKGRRGRGRGKALCAWHLIGRTLQGSGGEPCLVQARPGILVPAPEHAGTASSYGRGSLREPLGSWLPSKRAISLPGRELRDAAVRVAPGREQGDFHCKSKKLRWCTPRLRSLTCPCWDHRLWEKWGCTE